MTRTTAAIIVVSVAVAGAGCAAHRERGDDAGIRTDSGADAGPMCGAIRCMAGCTVVTGADGCAACRCEPPPPGLCASDADCVVAYDLTLCCSACPSAVTAAAAAADQCLAQPGDPFPSECFPSACDTEVCPACANPLRAVCAAGECVPAFDCAPGDVVFRTECVPRCRSHADCAIATDLQRCCGRPCDAYPRALALDRPCWAVEGETGGGACPVPPDACAGLGCAFMGCPAEAHAVCIDDGTCAFVETTAACPPGYEDIGGRCVVLGG